MTLTETRVWKLYADERLSYAGLQNAASRGMLTDAGITQAVADNVITQTQADELASEVSSGDEN